MKPATRKCTVPNCRQIAIYGVLATRTHPGYWYCWDHKEIADRRYEDWRDGPEGQAKAREIQGALF